MNSKCVWICVWNAFGCLFFWTLVLPSWSSLYPFGWMFFLIIKFGRVSFPCWGWELLFSLFTHVWYKMFSTNSANFSIFWEFLGQFFNITKLKEKKPDYIGHKNYWNKLILKYKYTMFVTKCWKRIFNTQRNKKQNFRQKTPPKNKFDNERNNTFLFWQETCWNNLTIKKKIPMLDTKHGNNFITQKKRDEVF